MKKTLSLVLALLMAVSLWACDMEEPPAPGGDEITVTDMIGREVTVKPGSYGKVVCVGAGALRMYSYVGDVSLLAGVEDIDNTSLTERPKMFDSVARPYVLAFEEVFQQLPSCGVGGPMAQAAEAEKILSCGADIVISEFEDVDKSNALQDQLGVPVITLSAGSKGVFDEKFSKETVCEALQKFLDRFDIADDSGVWFDKVKAITEEMGFTTDMKAYKADPDAFPGTVADVSTFIRQAVTGKTNSPDLYTVMQILGYDRTVARIKAVMQAL